MSNEFKKFPSIDQYKHAIKTVRDYCKHRDLPIPTLKFVGTVKVHGTNACVAYNTTTKEITYQSRERTITPQSDNAGFAMWAHSEIGKRAIQNVIMSTIDYFEDNYLENAETVYIYGEWAGKGVQPKVGVSELDKKFYIFSIVVNDKILKLDTFTTKVFDPSWSIFSIYDFPTYEVEIDFNTPELFQNQLVDIAMAVEEECPVAKKFGVTGIGEGVVFRNHETGVQFKVKGEKHSNSKVKTLKELAPIDTVLIEKLNELVEYVVTENRLKQGLDKMTEMGYDIDSSSTIGEYIKWVVGDVYKEELDTLANSGIPTKKIGNKIAEKARQYFQTRV